MPKFDDLEIKIRRGTLSISPTKAQEVRHYVGTDVTEVFELGRQATLIRLTVICETEDELDALLDKLHRPISGELYLNRGVVPDGKLYKRVFGQVTATRELGLGGTDVDVSFTAADPIPYDSTTGLRLYG